MAGFVAVVPLLALGRDVALAPRPVRAGLGWGLLAGLVFFLPLLVWINRFGYVPWILLATVQAGFVAAFVGGVAAWGRRRGAGAAAVVWWVGLEAARTRIPLGGFPWGVLGYTQHDAGVLLPLARLGGVLAVSAALVTVAVCLDRLVRTAGARQMGAGHQALAMAGPLLGVVAVLLVAGFSPGPPPGSGETIDIAAVQGNDQGVRPVAERTNAVRVREVAQRQLEVTRRFVEGTGDLPDVTVWPENAIDGDLRVEPALAELVGEAVDLLDGRPLLTGVLFDGPRPRTFYNVLAEVGHGGRVEEVYVKRKLVPFGEYVPARRWLDWVPALDQIPSDGLPGEDPGVFDVAGARIGPITCFENIFPSLVREQVRAGAEVLLVSTNNASFGFSPASRQHLAFSQVRAVETGRWLLHAGISGITAVVAPDGRTSQQTELFEQAVVRADLPLVRADTTATRVGDAIGIGAMILAALGLSWLVVERVRD